MAVNADVLIGVPVGVAVLVLVLVAVDVVVVAKMVVQKDGQTILTKNNTSQTGTIDIP